MAASQSEDKRPRRDPAEDNAFFPSPYSLGQFTKPKSDLGGADYPNPYKGKKKVLMIGADERYLLTDNGTFFSTGNHPVETLLPMYHLDKAGFAFDVATVSGNPVKFELWAMPSEDEEVKGLFVSRCPASAVPRASEMPIGSKPAKDSMFEGEALGLEIHAVARRERRLRMA